MKIAQPISPVDVALIEMLAVGPVRVKPRNNIGNYTAELSAGGGAKVSGYGPTPLLALKHLSEKVRAHAARSLPSGE